MKFAKNFQSDFNQNLSLEELIFYNSNCRLLDDKSKLPVFIYNVDSNLCYIDRLGMEHNIRQYIDTEEVH